MVDKSLKSSSSTINDMIDSIKLSIQSPKGEDITYILVEGDDDENFYCCYFDGNKVEIHPTSGKQQLYKILEALSQNTKRVIGICDADFDHLEGKKEERSDLFFTDFHDLEMSILFHDDVLAKCLSEYNTVLKEISTLEEKSKKLLENVIREVSYVGYIRWYNEKCQIKFDFKGLRFSTFVAINDGIISLDCHRYLEALNKRSKNKIKEVKKNDIDDFRDKNPLDHFFNLCSGHDVIDMIVLIIRAAGKNVTDKVFCSNLRVAFQPAHFMKTELYKKIFRWENQIGCQILKSKPSSLS